MCACVLVPRLQVGLLPADQPVLRAELCQALPDAEPQLGAQVSRCAPWHSCAMLAAGYRALCKAAASRGMRGTLSRGVHARTTRHASLMCAPRGLALTLALACGGRYLIVRAVMSCGGEHDRAAGMGAWRRAPRRESRLNRYSHCEIYGKPASVSVTGTVPE